jgi:hypothetical protein
MSRYEWTNFINIRFMMSFNANLDQNMGLIFYLFNICSFDVGSI